MSTRPGYAVASAILGIVVAAASLFAYVLAYRCGPDNALGTVYIAALFLSPLLLVVGTICGVIGFNAKRGALTVFGIMLALALGAAGIVQAVPHHDYPPGSPQCRFDL
jgi:hypothetical protein